MYLLVSNIPIYTDGEKYKLDGGWHPDVMLTRDYLSPHFGEITLVSPQLPIDKAPVGSLDIGQGDGIRPVVSFAADVRTRGFINAHKQWKSTLQPLILEASVVQADVDSPLRPIETTGAKMARTMGRTNVITGPDMDIALTNNARRAKNIGLKNRLLLQLDEPLFERAMRREFRHASLTMLKQGIVFDKYQKDARNPKSFCHTMHSMKDVISENDLEGRIAKWTANTPLRLVYFGRLVERKGIADSIHAIASALKQNIDVTFDVFGDGEQKSELQELAHRLNVEKNVIFHGHVAYGREFLQKIREYDALLFAPNEEDTPRMVFDSMACGLPLIASDIPFMKTRAEHDGAVLLFGIGDIDGAVAHIGTLHRDRSLLAQMSRIARKSGLGHTVEYWYGKRAEWTLEAHAKNDGKPRT